MKIIKHKDRKKPQQMLLSVDPMKVYLGPQVELQIHAGDTIRDIANEIRRNWQHFSDVEARQLAAFWFALGERGGVRPKDGWTPRELRSPGRRKYKPRVRA